MSTNSLDIGERPDFFPDRAAGSRTLWASLKRTPMLLYPHLAKDVTVEVRSGPLGGMRGKVQCWGKRDRLIVEAEILGRSVSLEVDPAVLDVV
jgi:hypothetical protein